MNALAEAAPPNSPDRAYAYIKERIIDLEFAPGQKLRAQALAEVLGLSRTPIREALGRLEQEGLVTRDAGWGYVVKSITFTQIFELFRVRESLEVLAATECLPHLTPERLKYMNGLLKRSAQALAARQHAQFRSLSREFHMAMASFSHNELLFEILSSINDRVRIVASMQIELKQERASEILRDNYKIMGALKGKNTRSVREAILTHIKNARKSFLRSTGAFSSSVSRPRDE